MPNPIFNIRRNTSRTNVDRPVAIEPAVEEYEGDNLPYRGVVDHGVSGSVDFRETAEDMPDHDGRKVPVYDMPEDEPDPVPVRIVNRSSVERRAFRTVVTYAGGTAEGRARLLLGQDDTRTRATIQNKSIGIDLWLGHSPESASEMSGYFLGQDTTYVTESQEPIYGYAANSVDPFRVNIAVEYRRSLDD